MHPCSGVRKYVVMGAQGSGKGTQARMLARDFDLVHIEVGQILRWNVQSHTKLGARVRRVVEAGLLVPDEVVGQLVKQRLDDHDWNYGFVLDGFPRNASQAMFFLERYDIDAAILIDVPEDVVLGRVLARRLCGGCGLDYNLIHHRPAVPDVCDVCKGRLHRRPDDTEEAVRERLRDYVTRTAPIVELFKSKELVVVVNGTRDPLAVQTDLRRKLGLPLAPPHAAGAA
jgi:adenylate kinase